MCSLLDVCDFKKREVHSRFHERLLYSKSFQKFWDHQTGLDHQPCTGASRNHWLRDTVQGMSAIVAFVPASFYGREGLVADDVNTELTVARNSGTNEILNLASVSCEPVGWMIGLEMWDIGGFVPTTVYRPEAVVADDVNTKVALARHQGAIINLAPVTYEAIRCVILFNVRRPCSLCVPLSVSVTFHHWQLDEHVA